MKAMRLTRILFLLTAFTSTPGAYADAPEKPNVILIMADDMGYSDLGCYGGEIQTPNLDSLARNGLRYRQFYNTSKCTTSRSCLLTGRYVLGRTYNQNYRHGPTLGEVLQAQGYRTLWSGKNHSSIRPPERGFHRFYGFQGGACSFWNPGPALRDGGRFPHIRAYEWMVNDTWHKSYIPKDPSYYMTDAITDNAVTWLKEYKEEDKPFFLYLAYNSPHWPLHAREKDIAKYKGTYDKGYQAIRQARYKRMVSEKMIDPETTPLFPEDIPKWESLSKKERNLESGRMEVHAAMVDNLDQNIGRVIEQLKAFGKWENTLICFFVDNGASHERDKRAFKNYKPTGKEKQGSVMSYECIGKNWARVANAPWAKHKVTSHEGGVCTPMIAHWPKGIQGKGDHVDTPGHLVDFMSTVLELSGGTYPKTIKGKATKPLEGVSLVPTFFGKTVGDRNVPIGYDFGMGRGVRVGKWKLVKFLKGTWELYDLAATRSETRNLAKEMPEKVKELERVYTAWVARCKAPPPKQNAATKSDQNQLTDAEKKEGWVSLFNGHNLEGWRNFRKRDVKPQWNVDEQSIHLTKKGGGDIIFDKQFSDFELKLQWRISKSGNSGIFIRSTEDKNRPFETGVEMQVLDDKRHKNGKDPKKRAGSIYDLIAAPNGAARPAMQWNDVYVIVKGTHYQTFLNGVKTADFDTAADKWKSMVKNTKFKKWKQFSQNAAGYVCLQDHGDKVWYRNLKIKELK